MAKWEARRYAGTLKNPGEAHLTYP
jgi:hypothetical protein